MRTVGELKQRVRELGLEVPAGVLERKDLELFVDEAEANHAAAAPQRCPASLPCSPLGPGLEALKPSELKQRLTDLGLEVPTTALEKSELVALVREAEFQQNAASRPAARPAALAAPLPPGWVRVASRSRPDRIYYRNEHTRETTWEPWFRQESRSRPGRFYYLNVETGDSTWEPPTRRLRELQEQGGMPRAPQSRGTPSGVSPGDITGAAAEVAEAEPLEPAARDYRDNAFGDAAVEDAPALTRPISASSALECTHGEGGVLSLTLTAAGSETGVQLEEAVAGSVEGTLFPWVRGPLIGRGSLGRVFRAVNQMSGQFVAVKEVQISPRDQEDNAFAAALRNEVEIMCELDHPHIVKYLGHDFIDNCLYMYMEYMPAGTLTAALNEFGPFDESLVSIYTRQLLLGMEYLHNFNPAIVHRDIKGSNVLLGSFCCAKLADFGCSKRTDSTMTHTMRGSIPWMAPEVIAHSRYGKAADVWSFGCVVIEMGTAQVPWGRFENQMAALIKIGLSQELPPLPPNISECGGEFIGLCVNRDPGVRLSATQLLSHAFVQHAEHSGET